MKHFKLIILVLASLVSSAQAKTWRTRARISYFLNDGSPLRIKRIMPREFMVRLSLAGGFMSLSLQRNTLLFSKNYQESKTTEDGIIISNSKKAYLFCYYHGHVIDHDSSKVAVSLCKGLKGSVMMNDSSFELYPSKDNEYVYIEMNDKKEQHYHCGVKDSKNNPKKIFNRVKRNVFDTSRKYVEVFVAVDHSLVLAMDNNAEVAKQRSKEILNIASLMYTQINIVLMVTGLTVLENPGVPYRHQPHDFLISWKDYRIRYLQNWTAHDLAVLVAKYDFQNTIGMALEGVMCRMTNPVAFIVDVPTGFVAPATLAHEIGHTFGSLHDENYQDCKCQAETCIMESQVKIAKNYGWSDCSITMIVGLYDTGTDNCLYNEARRIDRGSCGDGFQDPKEQCDCGNLPPHLCNQMCCDKTCSLVPGNTCAQGLCCDIPNCKIKSASVVCRPSIGECDIKETCDGSSNLCPQDIWIPNTARCTGGNFCYKGECVNRDATCSMSFGTRVQTSIYECYEHNKEATKFNNCGRDLNNLSKFLPCHPRDALCGTLQCHSDINTGLKAYKRIELTNFFSIGDMFCTSRVYDVYPGMRDLSYVPDGARCGKNMLCLDKKCIRIGEFQRKTLQKIREKVADAVQLSINIDMIIIIVILGVCIK